MYKKSRYNFLKILENGEAIIYNTNTGAVAAIEKKNTELIKQILNDPSNYIDNELFEILYNNGFVIDNDYDEYSEIKLKYDKTFDNDKYINIVILPVEMCNFTCPYCFVYNYKNKIMDNNIYESIKKYIRKRIKSCKKETGKITLKLAWFGGEPLLQKDKILSYMKEIKEEFDEQCNIYSSIITNGYYLSYQVFSELVKSGISQYQITFDGAKEDHDNLRKLHNGEGSFDKIIDNLKEIILKVDKNMDFSFAIRINFLKNTYEKIFQLIDDLILIIGDDKRFQIYCRPIYNFETKRDCILEVESDIFSVSDGLNIQNKFTRYIAKKTNNEKELRMINDYLPMPTTSWCAEDNTYSIIVGSDSSIYICDSLIGDEEVSIGKLDEDGNIEYNEKSYEWRKSVFEFENFTTCKECKLLPICVGSCKRERISGVEAPCLWSEEEILELMEKYYILNKK